MLPRVILHNAVSIDGRMDCLEPPMGLFYGLAGRFGEDATLAGCDTLLQAPVEPDADPDADWRAPRAAPGDRRPLLVVPDSRGRLRTWRALLAAPFWRAGVSLCSRRTPPGHRAWLRAHGIASLSAGTDRVDLRAALRQLAARHGVRVVRVDAGGALNGALLRAGLVHEVSVVVCPTLVGGLTPQSIFRAADLEAAAGAIDVRLRHVERLVGGVVWLRYRVVR